MSERRLQAEIAKNKRILQDLEDEADDWIFDCVCGVYGQIDDGTHSVACERCSIWQHSKCVGISEEEADRDDFQFLCKNCRHQQSLRSDDTKQSTIKLKISRPGPSTMNRRDSTESPVQPQPETLNSVVQLLPNTVEHSDVSHPRTLHLKWSQGLLQHKLCSRPPAPLLWQDPSHNSPLSASLLSVPLQNIEQTSPSKPMSPNHLVRKHRSSMKLKIQTFLFF